MVVEDSLLVVVVVEARSATRSAFLCFDTPRDPLTFPSAQRLVTSLVTAPRLADTVAKVVDMVVNKEATEVVDLEEDVVREAKPATLVADTATCPVSLVLPAVLSNLSNKSGDCTQGQKCYNCGEVGHLSRDCPSETSNERTCYKCKQPGHVQAQCPN